MFCVGKIIWPVKKTHLHWLDAAKTTPFMWMSRRNPEMASQVLPNFSWLHFFLFFKSLMRCFPYSLASVIVASFISSWRICLAYLIMVSLGSFFTVKFRIWAIQMELQSPTTGSYIGCSISYKARVMLFPISPWGITQAKFLSMCVHYSWLDTGMFPIHRMAGHNQASMLMDVHISAVNLIVSTLAFLFSPWNFFLQPLPSQPKGWEENVKKQTKKKTQVGSSFDTYSLYHVPSNMLRG